MALFLQYRGPPVAYIQQVLVKAAVSPWDSTLVPVDVFRSPLGRVFSLLEEIRNHVHNDGYGKLHTHIHCLSPTFSLLYLKMRLDLTGLTSRLFAVLGSGAWRRSVCR